MQISSDKPLLVSNPHSKACFMSSSHCNGEPFTARTSNPIFSIVLEITRKPSLATKFRI
uniref:Uncharacterized protein n=1 Tax=Arundo donax TaxID=35708 RepID=A0A0A9BSA0_ARUDO